MIIPSLVSTFGLYLMWIFSDQAVPTELLEAARVDGAGEFRTFFQVSLPLLAPGIVTTGPVSRSWRRGTTTSVDHAEGFELVSADDRSGTRWKPNQASTAGGQAIQNLVVTGSLIAIVPLVISVPCALQKVLAVRPCRRRRQENEFVR